MNGVYSELVRRSAAGDKGWCPGGLLLSISPLLEAEQWQDESVESRACSGDKNYDLSHSLVRLGTKEVTTLK